MSTIGLKQHQLWESATVAVERVFSEHRHIIGAMRIGLQNAHFVIGMGFINIDEGQWPND